MEGNKDTVVVIGAGPAGCTLACLLAMRGIQVVVFDDDKRPDLLVGESLVPSVIPVLRALGIEDRVKAFSVRKPGASFFHGSGTRVDLKFQRRGKKNPGYAYNVPRPEFDDLLRERAGELGVRFVDARAKVQRSNNPRREIELCDKSLALAGLSHYAHPSMLVDATGRSRLFARTLELDVDRGGRNDVSYFAHYENFVHDEVDPGQIIISVLGRGWSWRIPLKGKLSVGIVIDRNIAMGLGGNPSERLDNAIKREPLLREKGRNAKRVSDVMTYSKYQRITKRGSGEGWVMLGDAFGFVDPMLSPGLFMALESAYLLDKWVFSQCISGRRNKSAEKYCAELLSWHQAWQELIEYFYDGRILRMHEAGKLLSKDKGLLSPARLMERHVTRVIQSMASGVATRTAYNRRLLKGSSKYLIWNVPEAQFYAVK
jgi:flavin-dependent dehydrogenase